MYLSFKSVYSKEHKGVICNMTYKVPYITDKIIFTQSVSYLHPIHCQKDFTVNTHPVRKMLVSLSDFSTRPVGHLERTSKFSQSTHPVGECFGGITCPF